jgi:hypothetical protein
MSSKRFVSEAERVLDEHEALPALQMLADAGCIRAELISLLELAPWTDESWENLVGMDLRAFRSLVSQIRDCAGKIDRLNRSELIYHCGFELGDPRFAWVRESPTLPEQLFEYAEDASCIPSSSI